MATTDKQLRVAMIGSGNFACCIVKNVGENTKRFPEMFHPTVNMWVFEENIEGRNLSDIINEEHENVKYLPGVALPDNVLAVSDLRKCCENADVLIFCMPHQFIERTCRTIRDVVDPTALVVSLIKGFGDAPDNDDDNAFQLISQRISTHLGVGDANCAVMMGANLANEIAQGQFCESTVGCSSNSPSTRLRLKRLLETDMFRIRLCDDPKTVEMCGALKNVVAVGAGFVDGLGEGIHVKSALIKRGLIEMMAFVRLFRPEAEDKTFLESCGVADLVTTCFGGRNRLVGEEFARRFANSTPTTLHALEAEMLNGQKLQGPMTANEVIHILKSKKQTEKFPIFKRVDDICKGKHNPQAILEVIS